VAQRVQVLLVCDVHGDDTTGAETISFSLDGAAYEIDVCEKHADEMRDALAPFVGAARRAGGRVHTASRRGRGRSGAAAAGGDRQRVVDIRAWAKAQGFKVSERGRIAQSLIEQYEAAH